MHANVMHVIRTRIQSSANQWEERRGEKGKGEKKARPPKEEEEKTPDCVLRLTLVDRSMEFQDSRIRIDLTDWSGWSVGRLGFLFELSRTRSEANIYGVAELRSTVSKASLEGE